MSNYENALLSGIETVKSPEYDKKAEKLGLELAKELKNEKKNS